MRTAGFLGKTVTELLHGVLLLCPEEQILWNAYYSLFPFDPLIKPLADLEAAVVSSRVGKKVESIYPIECQLNQPIEDTNPFSVANRKKLIAVLNAAAAGYGIKLK